eukprot:jgi/Chlat1/4188/Chrsp27S04282
MAEAAGMPASSSTAAGPSQYATAQLSERMANLGIQPDANYEYLDHTADIQLHAWGACAEEAFANAGLAMFNYMVPIDDVEERVSQQFEASGHDMESLLFAFLDELLFIFSTEFFVCKRLVLNKLDRDNWSVVATGHGERFDRKRHQSGTEVKAITYSNLQVHEQEGHAEVYVIVDI